MRLKKSVIAPAIVLSGLALSAMGAPASDVPAPHKQGEVTYIMGGVGTNEADAIKHVARYYPLEMEFLLKARPRAEYLADVKVRVKDAHHKIVLNVTADGPFLLAKLPAGKYTVTAERNGDVKSREVQIAAHEHRRIVFEWLA